MDDEKIEAPAGWQPPECRTEDEADAILNRVLAKREERQRLIAQHEKRLRAIESEIEWVEGWALPLLDQWLDENPPKRGKSRDLPRGRIGRRSVGGGVVIKDEDACLAWAVDHAPDAITIPEPRISKSKLPDDCPHVERYPKSDVFYVRGPK